MIETWQVRLRLQVLWAKLLRAKNSFQILKMAAQTMIWTIRCKMPMMLKEKEKEREKGM